VLVVGVRSGLWNVNHVRDATDGQFLDVLEARVRAHGAGRTSTSTS
jgi:hypothetical protein